jgi:DNA-binding transcriptional ArsR family regulator
MVEYNTQTLDRTFHALAHPIRRQILQQLAGNELTILEIAERFDISLNGVSKHLKVLEQAGLINREIHGRTHFCTIGALPLREAEAWIAHYRPFWEQRLDALGDFLEKRRGDSGVGEK